ncbi:MAG: transglutaminase [Geobacteraceae bacterium GWC2_48_7]|nr:MAG: transglutaminase [Geobacteraceae bacterium GWC2_48_7]
MINIFLKLLAFLLFISVSLVCTHKPAIAAAAVKLEGPPLGERWYGIYADNERVGFYRQNTDSTSDGYRFEGTGIVRMKVMGFAKDSSFRESYLVAKNLALRSFEVEQKINGIFSRVTGKISDSSLRLKTESNGKVSEKLLRLKTDIIPASALNLYPLMRDATAGRSYKVQVFESEEVKIKEVNVNVLGEEQTPEGQPALKLRNNLYPFVNNDIWIDKKGNTLYESVRDGLVITRSEDPKALGAFVANLLVARKDLIHDFSLIRTLPPLKDQQKLKGLTVEISGWDDSLPLQQDGRQAMEKSEQGRLLIRTDTAIQAPRDPPVADRIAELADFSYLRAGKNIESDAPEIVARAKELAAGNKNSLETVKTFAIWTADYLKDTLDDNPSAMAALKAKSGNAQAHARLFTALARAAGIPTRYVAGLISLEGKGFVYHSWAECLLGGEWIAVDPTYAQAPADPAHLKFITGDDYNDIAPLVSLIGRLRINILDMKY